MWRLSTLLLAAALVVAGAWTWHLLPASARGTPASTPSHVTLVMGHPTRLTVSFYRWSGAARPPRLAPSKRGTTGDTATITQIVGVLNQVNRITPGAHSCPSLPGNSDVLRFGYSNGDSWTVNADGCFGFSTHGARGTALGDPPVYNRIYKLMDQVASGKR